VRKPLAQCERLLFLCVAIDRGAQQVRQSVTGRVRSCARIVRRMFALPRKK
jgi:hypothetical protein